MMKINDEISRSKNIKRIAGVNVEIRESGIGNPILYLHPGDGFNLVPALEHLSNTHRVIAPSHPGFDGSDLPAHYRSVDDLAYWYLDLIKELNLKDVVLLGVSFGAWIAAEIAIKSTERLGGLVLVDPIGARFTTNPRECEIADMFGIPRWELPKLLYHAESMHMQTFGDLEKEKLLQLARNHDSFCIYGWSPILHDPKLASRLHRIDVPTSVIWGQQDRVVSVEYGKHWVQAIPGSSFTAIEGAGHYPHVEQPEMFQQALDVFLLHMLNHKMNKK